MVPVEYCVFSKAEIPREPTPFALASPAKSCFQAEKPAPVLPQLAAFAPLAIINEAATSAAATLHPIRFIVTLRPFRFGLPAGTMPSEKRFVTGLLNTVSAVIQATGFEVEKPMGMPDARRRIDGAMKVLAKCNEWVLQFLERPFTPRSEVALRSWKMR
jgi:hypothetical protein